MKIAYLVHDLTDAAVKKRVSMFLAGGAELTLAGFRRQSQAVADVGSVAAVDLGETFDGRLAHRALSGLSFAARPAVLAAVVRGADVVVARNLEMLLIAARARDRYARGARLVYECLDIHEAMVGNGVKGRALRALEGLLLRRTDRVIISSAAFQTFYFDPKQPGHPPLLLLENKVLDLSDEVAAVGVSVERASPPIPPWRIGWFGILRAQKALDSLCAIARALPGEVEIVIRGRPTTADFVDFEGQIAATPGVSFGGAYRPEDLAGLYAGVHFCWAIDLTSESGNSRWLLPNRIYEGGRFGSVAIAADGTETHRWLANNGTGVMVKDPIADTVAMLSRLTPDTYLDLRRTAMTLPRSHVVAGTSDCEALVLALAGDR
jgi:hypothetical protein